MTIFLYGPDGYRLKQARQAAINEFQVKHSAEAGVFYFDFTEEAAFKGLTEALKSNSFFSPYKLLVVSGTFSKKAMADKIIAVIEETASLADTILLFSENGSEKELSSKSKELFKALSAGKMIKSFDPLTGQKLVQWVKSEVEKRGCAITNDALERMIDIVGNDSWRLTNEVDKLTAYKKKGEITLADVKLLISERVESNVFGFVDMLASGNKKTAIALLYKELQGGTDPYQIFGAVIYQLRNMLVIKDLISKGWPSLDISKKAGIHPFVVRKTMNQIAKFEPDKLKFLYQGLLNLDINFKNGLIDLDSGLDKFILSV